MKGSCDFMGENPSQQATTVPCLVAQGIVVVEVYFFSRDHIQTLNISTDEPEDRNDENEITKPNNCNILRLKYVEFYSNNFVFSKNQIKKTVSKTYTEV